ncbi:3-oxoacyl-[acyl-carrier-protein] reductase, partial [human gut metagenome]
MNANPFSLAGKRVLVTGASSGIGRAAAIECARAGAELLITGRDEERLLATLQALDGGPHRAVAADLTDPEGIERLVDKARGLDGVVHSAGIACSRPFPFVGRKVLDGVMEINFYAPAELTRRLLRASAVGRGASLVFVSSVAGLGCSAPGESAYAASKGAVSALARGMAIDLAPKGIRVNSVCPGVVETALFDAGT